MISFVSHTGNVQWSSQLVLCWYTATSLTETSVDVHVSTPASWDACMPAVSPLSSREGFAERYFAFLLAFSQERDLRERPTTCRTEYIRACAELSLSPIPVFDHLLAPGSRHESGSSLPEEGRQEGEGQGLDAASPPVFDLDLRRCEYAEKATRECCSPPLVQCKCQGYSAHTTRGQHRALSSVERKEKLKLFSSQAKDYCRT